MLNELRLISDLRVELEGGRGGRGGVHGGIRGGGDRGHLDAAAAIGRVVVTDEEDGRRRHSLV